MHTRRYIERKSYLLQMFLVSFLLFITSSYTGLAVHSIVVSSSHSLAEPFIRFPFSQLCLNGTHSFLSIITRLRPNSLLFLVKRCTASNHHPQCVTPPPPLLPPSWPAPQPTPVSTVPGSTTSSRVTVAAPTSAPLPPTTPSRT